MASKAREGRIQDQEIVKPWIDLIRCQLLDQSCQRPSIPDLGKRWSELVCQIEEASVPVRDDRHILVGMYILEVEVANTFLAAFNMEQGVLHFKVIYQWGDRICKRRMYIGVQSV